LSLIRFRLALRAACLEFDSVFRHAPADFHARLARTFEQARRIGFREFGGTFAHDATPGYAQAPLADKVKPP
jgi:hypothetical protein